MDAGLLGADTLTPALALGLGLAIGLEHAFEPDHVAAVSTQTSGTRTSAKSAPQRIRRIITRSSLLGVSWGAGHTTTIVLFGLLAYATASLIQDWVFTGLELVVGIMLVVLGVATVLNRRSFRLRHAHRHTHEDGTVHAHEHGHADGIHRHTHRSYVIGLVHGLAGSGAVVALAATIHDGLGAVLAFLLIFGAGSIAGMCMVGGLLGVPLALAGQKKKVQTLIRYAAGAFSLTIGISIVYEIWASGNLAFLPQ